MYPRQCLIEWPFKKRPVSVETQKITPNFREADDLDKLGPNYGPTPTPQTPRYYSAVMV